MKNKRKRTSDFRSEIRWFKIKKQFESKFKFKLYQKPLPVIILLLERKIKSKWKD